MPSNVRVAVRMRPLLQNEINQGHKQTLVEVNPLTSQISISQDSQEDSSKMVKKTFKFDKIIDSQFSQAEVFEQLQIKPLISKVMEGFHATIFAYGQTGSGKTFTMEGYKYNEARDNERAGKPIITESGDNGITIRAIREAFTQAQEMRKEKHITISCSFLQIYNEKVFDLLNAEQLKKGVKNQDQAGLRIRWNKNEQFTVENLYVFKCDSPEHALVLYNKGIKNKIIASHNLNQTSSRSHAIFTLIVDMVDNASVENQVQSKLQLVDLAGSERQSATGTTGLAQKESIDINKSLFTLRKVITGLAEGSKKTVASQHIPYRDSKLTCLLKQSLGGNSYCLMIACLSPSDAYLEENISTLNYATKASFISNEPLKNEDPKMKLINELKQKVAQLQRELSQANNHIEFLSQITGQPLPQTQQQPTEQIQSQNQSLNSSIIQQQQQQQPDQLTQLPSGGPLKKPTTQIIQKPQQNQQYQQQQEDAFLRLDPQQLSSRLIESVAMVKELMGSNRVLRDTVDSLSANQDRIDSENYLLQQENRDLRDRIEILESVIGASTVATDFDQLDWRTLIQEEETKSSTTASSKFGGSGNQAITEMASELIETKRSNRSLESEVETLKRQLQDLSFEHQAMRQTQQQLHYHQQQHQASHQQQLMNIYQPTTKQPPHRSQSNKISQPQSKQDALKMLNEMMSKRVEKRQTQQQQAYR